MARAEGSKQHVVKVHKRGLIVLPAKLRRKYGIKEGAKLALVEGEEGITLIPIRRLEDLYGVAGEYGPAIDEMIREIREEREGEARS